MDQRPNIFTFASSELSQDAILCWLLAWAHPNYKDTYINQLSLNFLRFLFVKAGKPFPDNIRDIELIQQQNHIDIQCIINKDIFLLIKDKTGSIEHSGQLARYKPIATEQECKDLVLLYIQTGDQGDYHNILQNGYTVIKRYEILSFFKSFENPVLLQKSQNVLLEDFITHLQSVEDDVKSYKNTPLPQWTWNAWKGFYEGLQEVITDGAWKYVPNPAGGFLGFFWNWNGTDQCEQYLQLEQEKLCFKIYVENKERRSELRDKYYCMLISAGREQSLPVQKPERLGYGQWMTVAIWNKEYRMVCDNGLIDMSQTIKNLRRIAEFMNKAILTEVTIKI